MSKLVRALPLALRLGLGGLFAYASFGKLHDPTAFAREIANYQLFPKLAPHIAATLPMTELVAAIALLMPRREIRQAGALALTILMLVLLFAVTSVVLRGVNVDCGCFGAGSGAVTWLTVLRNAVLLALTLYLVRFEGSVPRGAGADGARGEPARERGEG